MLNRIVSTLLIGCTSAFAVSYTDWTSATVATAGSASGTITLPDASTVGVEYSGEVAPFTQVNGSGANYYVPSGPYLNSVVSAAPASTDIITLVGGSTLPVNTVTFSKPVTDPVMLIVSLGRPFQVVTYDFDAPFLILSSGPGYFGGGSLAGLPGDLLEGREGHGAIQFQGTFSSISWSASPGEVWHGFTLALPDQPTGVPEVLGLGGMLMAAASCLGFGWAAKRGKV